MQDKEDINSNQLNTEDHHHQLKLEKELENIETTIKNILNQSLIVTENNTSNYNKLLQTDLNYCIESVENTSNKNIQNLKEKLESLKKFDQLESKLKYIQNTILPELEKL